LAHCQVGCLTNLPQICTIWVLFNCLQWCALYCLLLLLLVVQGMYDKLDQLQPMIEQLGKAHRMKV
jgi:hypothetical protein